jgi:predicted XRE-type DNA-binding protein
VFEIALKHRGDAYRVIYAVQIGADLWVIDAFQKKSKTGNQDAADRCRSSSTAYQAAEGTTLMDDDEFGLIRGSGNVFRDMGDANADVLQLKAILASKIIEVLDEQKISVRRAHELTGFAAADFSRVRQAKLQRFTVDRLMQMLAKLNHDVEVSVSIRPRPAAIPAE